MKQIFSILTIIMLLCTAAGAQQQKTVGITYDTLDPTNPPTRQGSEWRINITTGRMYRWHADSLDWYDTGDMMQYTGSSGTPTWIPAGALSRLAIDSTGAIYYYDTEWVHVNDIPDVDLSDYLTYADTVLVATHHYVASQGFLTAELDDDPANELQVLSRNGDTIFISDGNYIILPPSVDSDTSGWNQAFTFAGDTLIITDDNGTLRAAIPLQAFIDSLRSEMLDSLAQVPDSLITGAGVAGYIPSFLSAHAIGPTALYWNGITGRLGIGTVSPSSPLHTYGTAAFMYNRIETSQSAGSLGVAIEFKNGTNMTTIGANLTRTYIYSGQGSVENLTVLHSNGNVGIGQTNPTARLQITGEGSTSLTTALLVKASSGLDHFEIKNNGSFYIRNTTFTDQAGVIYKNGVRFLHNFNYGNNGVVTTLGNNLFLGENSGNFTMGSTATSAAEASNNLAIGSGTMITATKAQQNLAVGTNAMGAITTASYCTGIGESALRYNYVGNKNIAIGYYAMASSTGSESVAIGSAAMQNNTIGNCVAIGTNSQVSNNGGDNVTIGNYAFNQSGGARNTAVGNQVMQSHTTGNDNIAIGRWAARYYNNGAGNLTSMSSSIIFGVNASPLANAGTNEIVIGPNAIGLGSNTTRIGNSSTTRSHLDGILTVGVAANNVGWVTGPGSPEGVVTANPGSLYTNIGGGAGTTLYVKETGTGNTGWIAK